MPSEAAEDYLKAIYKIRSEGVVKTTEIARAMDVSSASATTMVKRLADMDLVRYIPYQGVELTPKGLKTALNVIRNHRLLELYLTKALGYSWDEVHKEAEQLEHHISEEFEERISEFLGFPTHDPHGDPIPSKDGKIIHTPTTPLTEVEPGQTVQIQRVCDASNEMLRYFASLDLIPQTVILVISKEPFKGPITISITGRDKVAKNIVLGHEVSSRIFVAAWNDNSVIPAEK